MKVCIHRGAHHIGGSCVEVEHEGARIVLDVGRPLEAKPDEHVPLPSSVDDGVVAVLISHYHLDHWGLVDQVPASVPIYIGEAAARILTEAAYWTDGAAVDASGFLVHRKSFGIGPFKITPFLNDHSAFDAYSLLVEAGGRRLFYSGDIRGHGRKSGIFESLVNHPPREVDVLLLEGTNIFEGAAGLPAESRSVITEEEVEARFVETIKGSAGTVVVKSSGQNIDRMVTAYNAAKRTDRVLVQDLYGASIARATANPNIPSPWTDHEVAVKVFVPKAQQIRIASTEQFWRRDEIAHVRIYAEKMAEHPERYVLISGGLQSAFQLDAIGGLKGASAIWSNWDGYLKSEQGSKWTSFMEARGIPWGVHHTSGHASVEDLKRLVGALHPGRVVPIHTSSSLSYPDLFENVDIRADSEWWEV